MTDDLLKETKPAFVIENKELRALLIENYRIFSEIIKPLIATVEALRESFPTEILNEIRAFNDHHVRSFTTSKTEEEAKGELETAKRHLTRIILDCYKCLIISRKEFIEQFEKKTKSIDLTIINNGQFYQEYGVKYREALRKTRKAKEEETVSKDERFNFYEEAFLAYEDLYDFIVDNLTNIKWARAKSYGKKFVGGLGWIIALILGAILTNNNREILNVIYNWLN